MRFRVLLIAQSLGTGGSERQLTEIAKKLDRGRFDVRVACFRSGGMRIQELETAGIPVNVFPLTSLASVRAVRSLWALARYLRRERIDLVHTFDPAGTIVAVPVARLAGTRVVLSSQRSLRSLRSSRQRRRLRWTDRLVQGIVVNSEVVRASLLADFGIDGDRVHLCRNGLDSARFPPRPQDETRSGDVIGSICVLRPEKDLPTLLRAFAAIRPGWPGARLRITGSGPSESGLRSLAAQLGVQDSVSFFPATDGVAEELHKLDIFVLPSTSEAFSNSLMEAMACECCVVASDAGGNPELVTDGIHGLLFPTGDAAALAARLQALLTDPGLRRRLTAAGSRRIRESFTLESAAQTMAGIYGSYLGFQKG